MSAFGAENLPILLERLASPFSFAPPLQYHRVIARGYLALRF